MEELKKANVILWIFAIILIGFTFVQAWLFLQRVLKFNHKYQVYSKSDLKKCVKTGIVAAIGPGISTIFLGISLMALMGTGYTFLRLGVIGAPLYELTVCQYAASSAGIDLTNVDANVLSYMAFVGAIGTTTYVLAPCFTLGAIETSGRKKHTGEKGKLARILPNASISVLILLGLDYLTGGWAKAIGYIFGFLGGTVCFFFVDKGRKNMTSWAVLIASIAGIFAAQITAMIVGG